MYLQFNESNSIHNATKKYINSHTPCTYSLIVSCSFVCLFVEQINYIKFIPGCNKTKKFLHECQPSRIKVIEVENQKKPVYQG